MSRYWLGAGCFLVVLVSFGVFHPSSAPGAFEPSSAPRVAPSPATPSPPDTLRSSSSLGTPLILSLPAELNEAPVSRYTTLKGPSLSGVVGQSFTWIPRNTEPGTYDIRLRAHHPDTQPDTLVLRISIES